MTGRDDSVAGDLQALLTCHKGVDLHAATARRVMQDRLNGGDRLLDLRRCEFHLFGGPLAARGAAMGAAVGAEDRAGPTLSDLLATGRCYNPNKHRFGHFAGACAFDWSAGDGGALPPGWPGRPLATEGGGAGPGLFDELLGGAAPAGHTALDAAVWARGQTGDVVSGVLWRLVLRGRDAATRAAGRGLVVARGGRDGLLANSHMDCWLVGGGGSEAE